MKKCLTALLDPEYLDGAIWGKLRKEGRLESVVA